MNKVICFNPMSKGGLGKSFLLEFLAAWLLARGINWLGSDLDGRHRTFSSRHPNRVRHYEGDSPQSAKESFSHIFRIFRLGQVPVHIVDCPAQGDQLFLDAIESFNMFAVAKAEEVSIVLFLFPIDEHESLVNMGRLVKFTGKNVKYVIVENKARNDNKLFTNSAFSKVLEGLGAKTVRLPAITSSTMLAMDRVESDQKRGISFGEFASLETNLLDPIMASELGMALAKMYSQYDSIAELILPPEAAKKVKADATRSGNTTASTLDDMFGFNFPD